MGKLLMHGYTQKSDDKNDLINKNMSIVKKIAYYYLGRVHQVVEIEDLLQIGMVGLIEAAHNYQPHEGVVFENYARLRVKGAIIDFLRKSSNLCRGTIKRKQDFDKASRKLEIEHKRLPQAEEVASELKIDVSELMSWKHDFAASKHQSIEEATEAYGDFLFSGDPSVEEKILNGELKGILRANIERLNKQQLLVLQLYYVEELNVYEIAEVLSVSTGRVSQIKSAAIKALRELIESQVNA
jgi:RNA polymerase sigma factor for flagellar operon FliA|tara:strand:- start:777 stop:1499 length:723 start_codon:yes stop_codon:yes gene_type:complete